jgi:hypothetical protein
LALRSLAGLIWLTADRRLFDRRLVDPRSTPSPTAAEVTVILL